MNQKQVKKDRKKDNNKQMMVKRFSIAIIVFMLLFGLLAGRLIWIAIFDGDKYAKAAQAQSETATTTISSKRGDIIDRNNVQLVTSTKVYNIILDPKVILSNAEKYLEPTVALINKYFEIPADELRGKIAENPNRNYIVLKKGLTFSEVEEFLNEKEENKYVRGVWLEESFRRNYVYDTLASSVLGFTQDDSGIYGIEYQYNDELTGNDGMEYTYLDSENNLQTVRKDPEDGYTARSTIDYNIQAIVEKWIAACKEETKAKTIGCIIQNPNTGEVLAMADTGNFNPNNPRDLTYQYTQEEIDAMSDQEVTDALSTIWRNFCVTQSYEPGSTFKPFTVAIGIEENAINPTDTFECGGYETFFPDTPWQKDIWCHNRGGCGILDVKGSIANSCNISLAQISQKIGMELFCKYQQKYGFGQYTGIDLPNEMSCQGLLYNVSNMTELDLATNSFGQNFNVTMIQMSASFCSLINGGYLYRPYIVKDIFNSKNELVKFNEPVLVSQTISQSTSDYIKECLRAVITEGTGSPAAIEGYKIAGKTGTAQKYDKEGEYYVISFEGFAPFDNPEVVCYVAIDEPETGDASRYSSELFHNIMAEVLSYMNIAPDDVE